ncbi:unnamed protein product [Schistosoma mattheei]|uniref:Uncharacterized protein n=1 Tax=Schistosoma mattheei TaxID=31246 RepID=A0A183PHH8_9TREM|nr:unnamed protein product [Schistosoma mattheei]
MLSQKSLKLPPSSETHTLESTNNLTKGLPDTKDFSVRETRQFPKCNQEKHFEKPLCELTLHHTNCDTLKTPLRTSNNLLRKFLETQKSIQSLPGNNKLPQKQIKAYLNPSQTPKESIDILSQWFKDCFTLSQLVKLGVDLSKVEAVPGVANMLMKLDFHNDIEPILWRLSDFGFQPKQIARIMTAFPKLLKSRFALIKRQHLSDNFKIMHWHLNLPADLIQIWPEALSAAPHLLHQRCTFLVRRKLFQPDPTKPLYTPLSSIVLQDDDEFCQKYGFTTEEDYDNFLRTL